MLKITSNGGTEFFLPIEKEITNIFALHEGLLIEFKMQKDLSPKEIYDLLNNSKIDEEPLPKQDFDAKNFAGPGQRQEVFSYVQLNFHPYKEFRPLGFTTKDGTLNWVNLPEKILYISKKLPIGLFYNTYTKKHGVMALNLKYDEIIEDRHTQMTIPAIYVLGLGFDEDDDKFHKGFPFTVANQIYQDASQENPTLKCKIVESHRFTRDQLNNSEKIRKESLMFCMISSPKGSNYIKIYSIIISFERFIHR